MQDQPLVWVSKTTLSCLWLIKAGLSGLKTYLSLSRASRSSAASAASTASAASAAAAAAAAANATATAATADAGPVVVQELSLATRAC